MIIRKVLFIVVYIFKSKIKVIFASGGIVENSKKQILFIHRKGKWDLPKGKAEKNETIRETALREVTEETGVKRLRIRKFYTNTFHLVRNNGLYFLKETSWFLMYSDYVGKLIPQDEEGIKCVKWKNLKQVNKIKEKTFKNIKPDENIEEPTIFYAFPIQFLPRCPRWLHLQAAPRTLLEI